MNPIRFAEPYQIFEITTRTISGKKRFPPNLDVRNIVIGCIARAQKIYPVKIFAFVFMSNHYHRH